METWAHQPSQAGRRLLGLWRGLWPCLLPGGDGEGHTQRIHAEGIQALKANTIALQEGYQAVPVAHEDMGGHIFVPLLLCLLGTLILCRPVQEHLNLCVCARLVA